MIIPALSPKGHVPKEIQKESEKVPLTYSLFYSVSSNKWAHKYVIIFPVVLIS